jgi:hypothetical protein
LLLPLEGNQDKVALTGKIPRQCHRTFRQICRHYRGKTETLFRSFR